MSPSAAKILARRMPVLKRIKYAKYNGPNEIVRPTAKLPWSLFQINFLQQLRADDFPDFSALLGKLLPLRLTPQDLVPHGLALRRQTIHRGIVFVLDSHANVPILRTSLRLFQKHLVVR